MLKTTKILIEENSEYSNPATKIARMVKAGALIPIVKGLYETDRNRDGKYYANCICSPSYLSFDYALSYYGMIPEAVYTFTSATFNKRKKKEFNNYFGRYAYRDVPTAVYSYGIDIVEENGYVFMIATKEKALCDKLYTTATVKNQQEMQSLLFEDLRIDEAEFCKLCLADIEILADVYKSVNVRLLASYMRRKFNEHTV